MTRPVPSLGEVTDLPRSVVAVIDRALAFDREDRFPDARSMQLAVRALLSELSAPDSRAPLPPPSIEPMALTLRTPRPEPRHKRPSIPTVRPVSASMTPLPTTTQPQGKSALPLLHHVRFRARHRHRRRRARHRAIAPARSGRRARAGLERLATAPERIDRASSRAASAAFGQHLCALQAASSRSTRERSAQPAQVSRHARAVGSALHWLSCWLRRAGAGGESGRGRSGPNAVRARPQSCLPRRPGARLRELRGEPAPRSWRRHPDELGHVRSAPGQGRVGMAAFQRSRRAAPSWR